ncbi:glycoside hydrolase [Trichodelitschia bisporula]|uniref:glucan 1,3-beta-glucosidase n=1 Tax=Trichodelitschia bisporula TaxID=703511 RepID=A0A6G1HSF9_9PEZI|nr:glycoside hydrolase [Trichodelitschia bisporula]
MAHDTSPTRRRRRHHSSRDLDPDSNDRDVERPRATHRRRTHRATDSTGALLPPPEPVRTEARRSSSRRPDSYRRQESASRPVSNSRPVSGSRPTSARYARQSEDEGRGYASETPRGYVSETPRGYASETPRDSRRTSRRASTADTGSGSRSSKPLSMDQLARLDLANARERGRRTYDQAYLQEVRAKEARLERERREEREREARREKAEKAREREERKRARREREEMERRGGGYEGSEEEGVDYEERWKRRTEMEMRKEKERRLAAEETPKKKKRRLVSGPYLEDGGSDEVYAYRKEKLSEPSDYTSDSEWKKKRNKRIFIMVGILAVFLAIIIPIGVVVSGKKNTGDKSTSSSSSSSSGPKNSNLNGISQDSIPTNAKGTYLDPFTWYDTSDFNVTYTDEAVGGLSIMGLNSTWDDSVQANSHVPAIKDKFDYGSMPVRGMNIGGWLALEPFITPSFFSKFSTRDGVIDEWTLCSKMGQTKSASMLDQHYATFITKQDFANIRAAGFDHVRIAFSYWAITTYDDDPYVAKTSWRYLLRGIEWARQNGLRVNLDFHGVPGSQNGWNHSGRQGVVGWLNGTDGVLNGQRTIDIHKQMSTFFAQPRYKNIVTMYGLLNEPRMTGLDTGAVLGWYDEAIKAIRGNNITAVLVFGDGFMGLDNWQGKMGQYKNLLLDVHQYTIFNNDLISLSHSEKLNFACGGWTAQMKRSMSTQTGFGPTMCGEWSQADTDCAQYINNVGMGSRWEGTLNTGNATTQVLSPQCPTRNNPTCQCTEANADPNKYSAAYKQWLLQFAEAQMESFEYGWGWFYWTWKTESAVQWSWKLGSDAGILPKSIYDRSFKCSDTISDFAKMGLPEYY